MSASRPPVPAVLRRRPSSRALGLVASALVAAGAGCVEPNRGILEVNPAADSVQVVTGITDTAFVRLPMPNQPVVVVKDSLGFRMPGVLVAFTPDSGSGFVTGMQVRTDSLGRARPTSWTAGPQTGTQTLWASVVGAPNARAARVPIRAPVIDPCERPLPYSLGATVRGTLDGRGCIGAASPFLGQALPSLLQAYALTVATPATWQFVARSRDFNAFLEVTRPDGSLVAYHDAVPDTVAFARVALPAGRYAVRAGAYSARAATGAFALSSTPYAFGPTCPANNVEAWLLPGATVQASLASGDCEATLTLSSIGTIRSAVDFYGIVVPPSRVVTVRMITSAFNALLLLADPGGRVRTFNDDGGGGTNALLQFTALQLGAAPGESAVVWVVAATRNATPGSYTISVDP